MPRRLTLLMSATRAPSLGVYTLWLLALIRLWMVKSSTSRFPFSWNLRSHMDGLAASVSHKGLVTKIK